MERIDSIDPKRTDENAVRMREKGEAFLNNNRHRSNMKEGKRKRGKLQEGEVFAVPLGDTLHSFGVAQVVRVEDIGVLFELFSNVFSDNLLEAFDQVDWSSLEYAYVNTAAAKKDWFFLGKFPFLGFGDSKIPNVFFGSPATLWTVEQIDGTTKKLNGSDFSSADFRENGFLQKVIWLHENIANRILHGKALNFDDLVREKAERKSGLQNK